MQVNYVMGGFRMTRQVKAASVSVISNTLLLIVKLVVGLLSGSVAVLSAAADSLNDLTASIIALISVRASGRPADTEHPYGHGKIENISAAIQALLIFAAAGFIVYEAIQKILKPEPLFAPVAGMAVMAITAVVDLFVSRYLLKVACETDSSAMRANAFHLTTDVWTAIGVFVTLGLVEIMKIQLLDPIVALIVAAAIIRVAITLTLEATGVLIDARLPEDELRKIEEIVMKTPRVVGFHKLRTRRSGPYRNIDYHLIVPGCMPVIDAHKLTEQIESAIQRCLPHATVVTHIEPDQLTETTKPDTSLRSRMPARRPRVRRPYTLRGLRRPPHRH